MKKLLIAASLVIAGTAFAGSVKIVNGKAICTGGCDIKRASNGLWSVCSKGKGIQCLYTVTRPEPLN
ncbi:MAG: hypothetical protein EOP48_08005 [Sphingobacteriales bacterium]|nr:MAG: hypothetical protein EOP48_08005 [Sphingobacteriales bacterium]